MSSLQETLDPASEHQGTVENPEAIRWRDYHEHIRIQREQEAAQR